jgi:uncharacterized beta-barrel protein YwiB (DUF1934 family)
MKKDVIIEVKNTLTDFEGETEEITLISEGSLYEKENNYYIIYKENLTTGEGTTTTIKVESGQKVILIRQGELIQRQVFAVGRRDYGLFTTPFGELMMTVSTEKVDANIDENGGKIFLEYDLEISEQPVSHNLLNISVRRKQEHEYC